MCFTFYKYQGTGNDFVIIDNRLSFFDKKNTELIARLCDRKFGIGADGLILLENHPLFDFSMVYYNADGNQSTMCGNGGRCIVHFAKFLGITDLETVFEAVDGEHRAVILENDIISLKMNDVAEIETGAGYVFLNTGSPHHVEMVSGLKEFDVVGRGADLRYGKYGKEGANINFAEQVSDHIFAVRTYERGVEDETLSCGTGVTAVAIAMHHSNLTKSNEVELQTPGGKLTVRFEKTGNSYQNIFLTGKAVQVFKGEWK